MSHCDLILTALRDGLLKQLGREHWETKIADQGDCWIWNGHCDREGYGRVDHGGRNWLLHRLLYKTAGGLLDERCLHHVCERRACINPAHLEQITRGEHLKRHGYSSLRQAWDRDRAKTHCGRGHELTPENTRIRTDKGWERRVCRTCDRDRQRVDRERVRRQVDLFPSVPAAEQLTL